MSFLILGDGLVLELNEVLTVHPTKPGSNSYEVYFKGGAKALDILDTQSKGKRSCPRDTFVNALLTRSEHQDTRVQFGRAKIEGLDLDSKPAQIRFTLPDFDPGLLITRNVDDVMPNWLIAGLVKAFNADRHNCYLSAQWDREEADANEISIRFLG